MRPRTLAAGLLTALCLVTPASTSPRAGSTTRLEFMTFLDTEPWIVGRSSGLAIVGKDDDGNVDMGLSDTLLVTASDPSLPGWTNPCDTFLGICNLVQLHGFGVVPMHPGPLTLTATSLQHPSLRKAVLTVNVAAGPPALFDLVAASPTASFGKKASVTLTVRDAFGFPAVTYRGKVHFTASGGHTLPADYVFAASDRGVKTFDVTFNDIGAQTVKATDAGNPSFTDSASVSVADAPRLTLQPWPDPASAGNEIALIVTAFNPDDTVFTGYRGTVHFTSSDPLLEATDYTFTANDGGSRTLSYGALIFKTAGPQTLTATDVAHSYITGTAALSVVGGRLEHITLSGVKSTVSAGEVVMFSVRGVDAFGNLAPHGFLAFSTDDPAADLARSGYLRTMDGGSRDFPVTFKTAGVRTLTVKGGSDTQSLTTTVIAAGGGSGGSGARFYLTPLVSPRRPGAPSSLTVTARDAFGNIARRYSGTVHFTSSDPRAALPPDFTFTTADRGVHTFDVTLNTAGTHWIRIADTKARSIAGTQGRIVVRGGEMQ